MPWGYSRLIRLAQAGRQGLEGSRDAVGTAARRTTPAAGLTGGGMRNGVAGSGITEAFASWVIDRLASRPHTTRSATCSPHSAICQATNAPRQ